MSYVLTLKINYICNCNICKHNRCKFTLYVAFDGIVFFVPGLNEEEMSFPSKLLTPEDKGIVQDFGKTHGYY